MFKGFLLHGGDVVSEIMGSQKRGNGGPLCYHFNSGGGAIKK